MMCNNDDSELKQNILNIGLWMSNYKITISNIDIFEMCKKCNFPIELYFLKLIQREKSNESSIDNICEILDNLNVEYNVNNVHDVFDILLKITLLETTIDINIVNNIKKRMDLSYFVNSNKNHSNYPLSDSRGHPQINWKECAHEYCNEKFTNEKDLIKHLADNKCYIPYFHKMHDSFVKKFDITPEKLKLCLLPNCPIVTCKTEFNSSDDAIKHFKEFGIVPFLNLNIDDKKESAISDKTQIVTLTTHFDSKQCVICYEKTNIINYPCKHMVFCINCCEKNKQNRCPHCSRNIIIYIPF